MSGLSSFQSIRFSEVNGPLCCPDDFAVAGAALDPISGLRYHGEQMAKDHKDHPLRPEDLAALRHRFARMSITGLSDAYHAAWLRCKLEPGGNPPRAAFIQELVQAWKELRKTG